MSQPNQAELDSALFAASEKSVAEIQACLKAGGDPNVRHGMDGVTPLMNAIIKGKVEAVNALLTVSDLSTRDKDGWTPLMVAAQNRASMIPALLPVSNLMDRDLMGRTALMVAARAHNIEALTVLMPLGGFSERSNNGMSAMDWATEKVSSKGFAAARHIKELAAELGLKIEANAAVIAEKPKRRGL